MKKIKYILITLLLLIPVNIHADSFHCSAPSSVESGETFGVTFYGSIGGPAPIWFGKIGSDGNASYSSGSLTISGEEVSSFSRTVYFTAGNPGSASFYVYDVDVASENDEITSSDTCTVSITEATRPNGGGSSSSYDDDDDDDVDPDKSSNNYLKSLSIDGVKISPDFNKDKIEYTAVVSGDKEKINIKGEVEDDKASVDGLGEKELKEGINKFEIAVTAENGQTRKYVISVTRKEKNPIEVTINKKKYTVAKKEIGLKVPEGFTKTTVVIDKQEVIAYSNSFTGYLLVALVDEDGNAGWFIYNQKNGTYTKYSEFKTSGLRLILLEPNKKDIPYKYKKCKVEINGEYVDGYALELGSNYRIVYALNMDTGEKNFYLYDMEENTFQRFYNTQVEIYRNLLKKLEIGLIGLGAVIIIMFIIIVSQFAVSRKTKKFIKSGGKIKKDEPLFEEEDDDDIEERNEALKAKIKEKSDRIDKEKELSKTKTRKLDKINDNEKTKKLEKVNDNEKTRKLDKVNVNEKTAKIDKVNENTQNIKVEEKPMTREEMRRLKKQKKKEMEEARREFFDL